MRNDKSSRKSRSAQEQIETLMRLANIARYAALCAPTRGQARAANAQADRTWNEAKEAAGDG